MTSLALQGVCLADYCDVLQCDRPSTKSQRVSMEKNGQFHCVSRTMETMKMKCVSLLRKCHGEVGAGVSPAEKTGAALAHAALETALCGRLTCDAIEDESSGGSGYRKLWCVHKAAYRQLSTATCQHSWRSSY